MAMLWSVISLLLIVPAALAARTIPLDGAEWTLSDKAGRVKGLQATVPGQVHLDLLRHGLIGEPYVGWNDWLLQWIAYDNWSFRRSFQLSSDDITGKTVWLQCDGLDTVANISVNEMMVGSANNLHRRYLFDLTPVAKVGENTISIDFQSAANYSVEVEHAYPYKLVGGGEYFNDSSRNFVRKTQSDFGWDWGPAFVPAGIWQNISIVTFESAYVTYVIPKTYSDGKSYFLTVTVCVDLPAAEQSGVSVDVDATIEKLSWKVQGTFQATMAGEMCHTFSSPAHSASEVEPDYLWWPTTVGDKPTLLAVTTTVDLSHSGSKISSVSVSKKVGFRHIEIGQEPVGDQGLTFYFRMNTTVYGTLPIYAKGSNFIPMDAFVNRVTVEFARRILQAAVDGNQNMIRVWGGGLYQPDWFYDLCDELGIMVWQEFMFGDALYPRNKDFLENVRGEVQHQVRKLGHHASIVLWSGNNENQGSAQQSTVYLVDYSVLYDQVVRATLWDEDMTRPYWPSSPSNGFLVDDKERGLYIQRWGQSGDPAYGDIHRYDYSDYCTDVTTFPRPRFASEFGFQSYPSFSSLSKISGPVDWSNNSTFMLHRQHHPDGNQQLQTQMAKFFHLPNSTDRIEQFKDFIYLTQVVQAICISAEAQHYRRLLSEDGAFTRGTLYWQLNDIWQAQSWSSVEYGGQWKLLHYFVKKVYEPVLVSPYYLNGDIGIYVVVDKPRMTIAYSLMVQVISWAKGDVLNTFTKTNLKSDGFTGVQVWSQSVADTFKGTSTKEAFVYMMITDSSSGDVLADNFIFLANFTEIDLPTPSINVSGFSQTQSTTATFSLTSTAVAPFVMLDSGNVTGNFNDNGFLVMPGRKYAMTFSSWEPFAVNDLEKNLTIRTVRGTYQ